MMWGRQNNFLLNKNSCCQVYVQSDDEFFLKLTRKVSFLLIYRKKSKNVTIKTIIIFERNILSKLFINSCLYCIKTFEIHVKYTKKAESYSKVFKRRC